MDGENFLRDSGLGIRKHRAELKRHLFLTKTHPMPLIDPVTMSGTASLAAQQSLPIQLLSTDLARFVTHAHLATILSVYYIRFPALVADPTSTLLQSLLPLSIIQITYTVCCLPATGMSTKSMKKGKPNAAKKGDIQARILVRILGA